MSNTKIDRAEGLQTLLATPVWEATAAPQGAGGWMQHAVLLCGLPPLDAHLPGVRCSVVPPMPDATAGERYAAIALAFFEALRTRSAGRCLVQLIAAGDDAELLAGLAGLVETAALENPELVGQLVLVEPGIAASELARRLQAEDPRDRVVRYRQGTRSARRWRVLDEAPATDTPCLFKEHGVYLVTGGLGGLGLLVAHEILARTATARVVLTGRRAAAGEAWTALAQTGRVTYHAADVADPVQVDALFASIAAAHGHGPLAGIFHSAGVLRDDFIVRKSPAAFAEVLRPKVQGSEQLDRASRALPLDFFVLFSSIASWAGNVGQADYAAANGFMEQFAAQRNLRVAEGRASGHTLAIAWPHWRDGGMGVDAGSLVRLEQRTGLRSMATADGMAALQRSLALPLSQVMVMHGDAAAMTRALQARPPLPPAAPATPSAAVPAAAAPELLARTREFLRQEFSGVLKIPAQRIETRAALEQYGIDSILAMDLTARLEASFGTLAKTLFFEYRSVDELAEHFVQAHAATLRRLFAAPEAAPAAVAPAAVAPAALSSRAGRRSRQRFLPSVADAPTAAAPSNEPIAIVGLSGRYPESPDLAAFWRNLRDGRDCITEVPASRWDWREHYSADRSREGAHYSKWGGFIDGVDEFDPRFFNIAPREAATIDPQERLFLQHAWMAIEDAGLTRAALQVPVEGGLPGQVGVYAGVMYGEYNLSGSLAGIANRVSYALNLHGPSLTLDTMCSSSLTALHLACQDLRSGRTSLALAGGVNVSVHPSKYAMLSGGQFISGDGHCQSFGEGGDGYIPGEGVGVAVLKRLSDAERDGNLVYGLIRGSALNHGGKTNGYTVPNPQAQAEAVRRALADAGIAPRHVSYIEAHGTGTKLGDPIEIAALSRAFRDAAGVPSADTGWCLIGSAKSNIGHCESAAGIAGLTKVLLQMKHGAIVPSLHSRKLNPHIDFGATPFVVVQALQPWQRPVVDGIERPRIAGVSSFGAGGANAHLVIEEYRAVQAVASMAGPVLVPLSARTASQLQQRARELLGFIERSEQALDLHAMAWTLQTGREAMEERAAVVVASVEELAERLRGFAAGDGWHRAQVRQHRDAIARLAPAEVDGWIAARELSTLAQHWAQGLDLPWERLLEDGTPPRRMSLPAYPFERERYWQAPSALAAAVPAKPAQLHPLVQVNRSTLQRHAYASRFEGDEPVSPLLALEMLRAALALTWPDAAWELRDTAWGEAIGAQVGISLFPLGDEAVDVELHGDGDGRVHLQSHAVLGRAAAAERVDLAALQAAGEVLEPWRGAAPSAMVLSPELMACVSRAAGSAGAPLSLARLRLPRAVPRSGFVRVRRGAAGAVDVDVLDEHGEVCVQMEGLVFEAAVAVAAPVEMTHREASLAKPTQVRLLAHAGVPDGTAAAKTTVRLAPMPQGRSDGIRSIEWRQDAGALLQALHQARADASLKVLLLTGQAWHGDRAACNDAIEHGLFSAIAGFPCPVIAVVDGGATGAGLLLAAACDFMVCGEADLHGFTDAVTGMFPSPGEDRFFRERLGDALADELLYRRTRCSGRQLNERGWACRVAAQVEADAMQLASALAGKSRLALELLKVHLGRTLAPLLQSLVPAEPRAPVAPGRVLSVGFDRTQLAAAIEDESCRAIVVSGDGESFADLVDLVHASPVPVVAALQDGQAWPFGLACDGFVLARGAVLAAPQRLARETAALLAMRLGPSLGAELLLAGDAPTLPVVDAADVLPQALQLAASWQAWPRAALTAWKQAQAARLQVLIDELPVASLDDAPADPPLAPVTLASQVVTATAHPDGVLVVEMHDRDAKNMFSQALVAGLNEAFAHAEASPGCKAVVLTGYDSYFATGGTRETLLAIQQGAARFTDETVFQRPMDCPLPVIAAIQGHGIGGGWSFGMFADLVLLGEESRYLSPYMGYGFTPGAGATLSFPARIGHDLARETLMAAQEISGQALQARGAALPVLPRREVLPAAVALARRIARQPRARLVALKRMWTQPLRARRDDAYARELAMHGQTFLRNAQTLQNIEAKFAAAPAAPALPVAAPAAPAVAAPSAAAIVERLRTMLAQELFLKPAEIDADTPFIDLGLDSITGVTWVRKINEHYGIGIEATKVYSHPTLAEIGRLVQGEAQKAAPVPPAPVEAVVVEAPAPVVVRAEPATRRPLASWRDRPAVRRQTVTAAAHLAPIAVIGMAGQFPKAGDVDAFWDNLAAGRDCIGEVPAERWRVDQHFQPGPAVPGKTNSKWLGALDAYDRFDPLFFNISPTEAECMEPQQRLFLQACWHGIENAGHNPRALSGSNCGVFVGCGPSDYHQAAPELQLSAQGFTGAASSILAARISYFLNLRGPCLAIETACSSSLVAMATACDNLNAGNCDLALAGGVYVMAGPAMHIMTAQAGMLSTDGRCFSFDERANGFVPGEAVGVVLLKRLADAERDQDRILGVIEGWGVNQDGKTNGITAPNEESQTRLIQSVHQRFGIAPAGIQLVEAHGTGTRLGDPIEVAGLKAAFGSAAPAGGCALGSVKSNIGHCLTAAGAAGFIKLLLALKHRALPPTIHYERCNDHIQLAGSPFYVNDRLQPWEPADGQRRRAAISSFGFSGTNAHLVLAEHVPAPPVAAAAPVQVLSQDGRLLVPLSARTEPQLRQAAMNLLARLRNGQPQPDLASLAWTLQAGREAMGERLGFVVGSTGALAQQLQAWLEGRAGDEVLQGQVRRHQEALQLIVQDDEMRATIVGKWLAERKLARLMDLWVKGLELDWSQLYGEARPQRIELPVYPFAADRYWLAPADGHAVEAAPAPVPAPAARAPLCHVNEWVEQPLPMRPARPMTGTVLIVHGGEDQGLAAALRGACERDGARVVSMAASEEGLQSVERVDALFFIASGAADELQLLRLVKALKQGAKIAGQVDTWLLTPGPQAVSGVAGLGHSLAQGQHQFRVRNLALSTQDLATADGSAALVDAIRREPASDRGEVFRLQQGRRWRQAFVPLDWGDGAPSALKHGGVYLIVGGSGIVGRVVTRQLIDKYRAHVVWLGRSAPGDVPLDEFADCRAQLSYLQADVRDEAALRGAIAQLKSRHARLHGAIFAGMVAGTEQPLDQADEAQFMEVVEVKSAGSRAFHAALRDEPLDFMCFFSSGQAYAFSGAARLPAYAAGIAHADAFVRSVRDAGRFPVGTIHWGFWQAAVTQRIRRLDGVSTRSLDALGDDEGFECFESFVAELQQGRLRELLCMRASPEVEALMNLRRDERVVLAGGRGPVPLVLAEADIAVSQERIADLVAAQASHGLDGWFAKLLMSQLDHLVESAGLQMPQTLAELRARCGILPKYAPWLRQSLALLAAAGLVEFDGEVVRAWHAPERTATWVGWRARLEVHLRDPDTKALAVLVDECLEKLPDILRGGLLATDVVFPHGSMDKVGALYKHNAVADTFNQIVAATVQAFVKARLARDPQARLRILEVGAGTGGTSALVFPALRPYRQAIAEYTYTDLSKAFFLHAEQHYLPDNPYIVCRRLDIEQPIEAQGIVPGSYDLLVSTNALHATKDIRRTLKHAKSALRADGVIVVSEMCDASLSTHLTFGLLDGWWLFEDAALRIPGCPGLAPQTWQRLLQEQGFSPVLLPGRAAQPLGNQVVVAHSDGVLRLGLAAAAPPAAAVAAPRAKVAVRKIAAPVQDLARHVRDGMLDCLSATLKMPAEGIATDVAFSDYGIDSILGVSFIDRVNQRFGLALNTAIIFEFASIERLARHVVAAHGAQIGAAAVQDEAEPEVEVEVEAAPPRAVHRPAGSGEIAIVGLSGQFPKAGNVEQFWRNLLDGVDGVQELPPHYLDQHGAWSPVKQKGRTRCKWAGILDDRDCFDPLFFSISPKEAESMNPHQRLVMQESWNALEDAGYNPKALAGSRTAIFIGAEPSGYVGDSFTGLSDAIIASRLSYALDFNGPAFVVNTGCSSSAVAIHLACESLRNGESDLVLAGGVNACLHQEIMVRLDQIEMLSPSGRCHTFDKAGDGTIISEGVGMLVLKRLDDALAAGDPVCATICGSGMNQDGASNGITAPNGAAQEQLILDVYQRFGIHPEDISYVEAHGTGTRLGDPVETNALVRAFRKHSAKTGWCAVGSAKSHIGHAAAAAGVIGIIKVLLSMRHRQLPRLLNFSELNPLIQFDGSPFRITTATSAWESPAGVARMAAVNSFGHSGTNVHLVLKEHLAEAVPLVHVDGELAFPLSAKTPAQLQQRAAGLLHFIRHAPAPLDLAALAFTLQVGREAMGERLGVTAGSAAQLAERLQGWLDGAPPLRVGHAELARWLRGEAVDWPAAWAGRTTPRRLRLPGYPFAKERYWMASAFGAAAKAEAVPPATPRSPAQPGQRIEDILSRIADDSLAADEGVQLLKMIV